MTVKLRPTTIVFLIALSSTLIVWVLRGIKLLSFMPGAVLWILILFSVITGILAGIDRTRRRY
ncbi:hypothetical protein GEI7407_0282 [Geitlerinema sp. PCC 7407]|nr:hypothetical protein GEI7407_0282 [Geitlerinema sp. PCC 7407]